METFDIFEGHPKHLIKDDHKMIPDSFVGLLVGKPNSGKSTLIEKLLLNKKGLLKKFDLVLFMAPYPIANIPIFPDRWCDHLSVQWIYDTIEHHKQDFCVENCLIIIDDLVTQVNTEGRYGKDDSGIKQFICNRRKIVPGTECSVLFTTQKYTLFPLVFRSQLQFLIFFNIPPNDYDLVVKEQVYNAPPSFKSIINNHFKKYRHNFVYIRIDQYGIFLNFDKQL